MMQTKNRILDDMARMTSGALGTLSELRKEVETAARTQFDRLIANMDLVTREEFDTVRAMAEKARTEQEDLHRKIAGLEAALAGKAATASKAAAKRTSTAKRKSTAKPAAARKK